MFIKKVVTVSLGSLLVFGLAGCGMQEIIEDVKETTQQVEKADSAALQSDVRNTVKSISEYIATNFGSEGFDITKAKVVQTGTNIVKIIPLENDNYTVVGEDSNGKTYTFDSYTGEYK